MRNYYGIVRDRGYEPEYYGPVYGSDHLEWTPYVHDAQGYSNKRDAIRDARTLQADQVVELGSFGARFCFNRIIQTVWRRS